MNMNNKQVLITGASGTVGSAILETLLKLDQPPSQIVAIDNNESELFFLSEKYRNRPEIVFYLSDIGNLEVIQQKFYGINYVLHCAALKHVILNEISPQQTILTNIIGTQNVITAALNAEVEKVIFTSSDKAVNPTNVMGTSKLMGERLITAANMTADNTIFSSTRFGNVVGSNGSVIPIFMKQILKNEPITITHNEMTRFIMSIDQAAELVLNSLFKALGGEVFVTKMPVVRIIDLADALIELMNEKHNLNYSKDNKIIIGIKPGEKLFEELMNDEEMSRSLELEGYFSVLPALEKNKAKFAYSDFVSSSVTNPYNSKYENYMNLDQIKEFLVKSKIFN